MATPKKAAAPAKDEPIAQMPPPGEENKDPATAAAEAKEATKSDEEKARDASSNARIATGGQGGGAGSGVLAQQGVGDVAGETMTGKELAGSTHPLAPEKPLVVPDEPEKK